MCYKKAKRTKIQYSITNETIPNEPEILANDISETVDQNETNPIDLNEEESNIEIQNSDLNMESKRIENQNSNNQQAQNNQNTSLFNNNSILTANRQTIKNPVDYVPFKWSFKTTKTSSFISESFGYLVSLVTKRSLLDIVSNKKSFNWLGRYAYNCVLIGNDIRNQVVSSFEESWINCLNNLDCTHYTDEDRRWDRKCLYKRNTRIRFENAILSTNTLCGIVDRTTNCSI
ncbi:unnamed protein product [Brachionus calyciflorus]|uniref:Uncharacterized protein n=1 Tax=Brachionus calyciflorus TaxID=104777 RepID=A0A813QGT5_9BILA|nr:unnamed protein product [Brachionus calyciflorus]